MRQEVDAPQVFGHTERLPIRSTIHVDNLMKINPEIMATCIVQLYSDKQVFAIACKRRFSENLEEVKPDRGGIIEYVDEYIKAMKEKLSDGLYEHSSDCIGYDPEVPCNMCELEDNFMSGMETLADWHLFYENVGRVFENSFQSVIYLTAICLYDMDISIEEIEAIPEGQDIYLPRRDMNQRYNEFTACDKTIVDKYIQQATAFAAYVKDIAESL